MRQSTHLQVSRSSRFVSADIALKHVEEPSLFDLVLVIQMPYNHAIHYKSSVAVGGTFQTLANRAGCS